ncbi:SC5A8-like protein [Mya arenaria]|uniref:SC5A8-like protein n=1 Tax=Mya arenaria TaxID=6604 RepID=A0ABY7EXR8_MYAAR|nr:SC5A8-like protein [Mya arenaria]
MTVMDYPIRLHLADYVVLGFGIAASFATGVFYAIKERKHSTLLRFHRGDGKLNAIPVAISLLVTFESSIFYLGYPTEIYIYGSMYWLLNIGLILGYLAMFFIIIPLFYPLQVTSVYEYLEMRHESRLLRQIAMWMGTFVMIIYAGIVIFGAAIAMESVTRVRVWVFIIAITVSAVIYTSLGGIKAVVVTDVVQGVIMMIVICAVVIYGTIKVGGFSEVIAINKPAGRLDLIDFDPNPYKRHTFWTLVIGYGWICAGISFRQPIVQRLNSTRSINEAKKVVALAIPGFVIMQALVMFEGLVAYAYFSNKRCDPLASGAISNPNQIVPYLVMDLFQDVPGITGLFLAALCSASLSTISSLLSGVSAVASEDIVRPRLKHKSEKYLTNISRLIVVLTGAVCIGVGILFSYVEGAPMGQIADSILGAVDGPVSAVFYLSIFCKFTTRRGLYVCIVVGLCFALWMSLGYNFSPGRRKTPWLPLGPTDGCTVNNFTTFDNISLNQQNTFQSQINISTILNTTTGSRDANNTPSVCSIDGDSSTPLNSGRTDGRIEGLDWLYSISYMYISLLVSIVTITTGLIASSSATSVVRSDSGYEKAKDMSPLSIPKSPPLPPRRDRASSDAASRSSIGSILDEHIIATPDAKYWVHSESLDRKSTHSAKVSSLDRKNILQLIHGTSDKKAYDAMSVGSPDDPSGSFIQPRTPDHIRLPRPLEKSQSPKEARKVSNITLGSQPTIPGIRLCGDLSVLFEFK